MVIAFYLVLGFSASKVEAFSARLERWAFYVTYDPASRASLLAHASNIDDVAPDYFSVLPSGSISSSADPSLDAAVSAAGPRIVPLVRSSLAGSALSPFLEVSANRNNLVSRIVQVSQGGPYAGVTLDFEGVDPVDRLAFSTFVQELAIALHSSGKILAIAVPAADRYPAARWSDAYDYAAIGSQADRVIVMAYAYRTAANPTPGPVSPLPWVSTVASYAASTIPTTRLLLGVGVWGYDWNVSQPGRALTVRFSDVSDRVAAWPGQLRYDVADASPSYSYRSGADSHVIWFEDADSVRTKMKIAQAEGFAGVAIWRLGQEAPGVWGNLSSFEPADYAVANGWFFTQTGGGGGRGYRVVDDDARFWSEFRRLGGVATLGYPISRRYIGADGFTYQAFQRAILQWRPELRVAFLANAFDLLSKAGRDKLLAQAGIPAPIGDDGSGGDWNRAKAIRLGWLTHPAIAATFYANPSPASIPDWNELQSIQLYGLPASLPIRSGPFVVQRFQRISLQLWIDDVPGMPHPGTVVGILGGDLVKNAGLIPTSAIQSEALS